MKQVEVHGGNQDMNKVGALKTLDIVGLLSF